MWKNTDQTKSEYGHFLGPREEYVDRVAFDPCESLDRKGNAFFNLGF